MFVLATFHGISHWLKKWDTIWYVIPGVFFYVGEKIYARLQSKVSGL
jgi:hypothetical protein